MWSNAGGRSGGSSGRTGQQQGPPLHFNPNTFGNRNAPGGWHVNQAGQIVPNQDTLGPGTGVGVANPGWGAPAPPFEGSRPPGWELPPGGIRGPQPPPVRKGMAGAQTASRPPRKPIGPATRPVPRGF